MFEFSLFDWRRIAFYADQELAGIINSAITKYANNPSGYVVQLDVDPYTQAFEIERLAQACGIWEPWVMVF